VAPVLKWLALSFVGFLLLMLLALPFIVRALPPTVQP